MEVTIVNDHPKKNFAARATNNDQSIEQAK
jgi:hypothetical protein